MPKLNQFFQRSHYSDCKRRLPEVLGGRLRLVLIVILLLVCAPTVVVQAQGGTAPAFGTLSAGGIALILVVMLIILALPVTYLMVSLTRRDTPTRSLLLLSTDLTAKDVIASAARRAGYRAVPVYRYEDALDKLRKDVTISMIIMDDSVPQYEAGLLLSMLQGSPIGARPLIVIRDNTELGQTTPTHRAEAVVIRPITEKALEAAIRQVSQKIEGIW